VTAPAPGRPLAAAVTLAGAVAAAPATGAALVVIDRESGVAESVPLASDGRWCLIWNHSVTGVEVTDCFRTEGEGMVLETSRYRDVAAGLGESPGAALAPDGDGGYVLSGLERPAPETGLVLRRAGAAVAQRIRVGGVERPLPDGRVGARVVIRLDPDAPRPPAEQGER
jgi:hypothetical protein